MKNKTQPNPKRINENVFKVMETLISKMSKERDIERNK